LAASLIHLDWFFFGEQTPFRIPVVYPATHRQVSLHIRG
jgi:hypothetical protein